VFVLPSRREGLGGAVLEAMALECPIVVSDLPSIREVVDDSTAVLVPPDDADALGAAVVRTLSTGDQTRRRAIAARRRFLERFTVDTIADQMLCFYARAMVSSRSGTPSKPTSG
jgi:glycosyltransferase involved in cell wall biosynthesis